MKKIYTKPEISFDNFGISSNFALSASCTVEPNVSTRDTCGYDIAGRHIFVAENTGCEYVSADGDFGVCYYVPTGDSNIFIS